MRLILAALLLSIACGGQSATPSNNPAANSSKPQLTDGQYLQMRHAMDRTDAELAKVKSLAVWPKYQQAITARDAATAEAARLENEIRATPEGKAYLKAVDEQVAVRNDVLKGVDTKRWTLGADGGFVPVVPAAAVETKK